MTAAPIEKSDGTTGTGLKRELKVVDAAAFSVGLIGPVGGMALLGAGAVAIIGRAAIWYGTEAPYSYFPYFVIVWLLIGLLVVVAVPGLAGRVRSRLAAGDNSGETFIP